MIRTTYSFLLAGLVTFSSMATAACSGGASAPKLASVKAGEMPSGGSWSAEYFSEDLGTIELVAKGDEVTGKWQRPHKDKWAEFTGTADGNLIKFAWHEYNLGCVGPNCETTGKGVFVYKHPEGTNVDDVIEGSLGRKDDEVGYWDFTAKKQRNVAVDLDKIGGTAAVDLTGADWDKGSNTEHNKPESPAHPN